MALTLMLCQHFWGGFSGLVFQALSNLHIKSTAPPAQGRGSERQSETPADKALLLQF